jgi:hypothetical protein
MANRFERDDKTITIAALIAIPFGVLIVSLMNWFTYNNGSTGYAHFRLKQTTIQASLSDALRFNLPNNWSIYYGRQAWREGTIVNANGDPIFEVTIDWQDQPPLVTEETPLPIKQSGGRVIRREQRSTRGGNIWFQEIRYADKPQPFIMRRVPGERGQHYEIVLLGYRKPWRQGTLKFSFWTLADRSADLEPLAWQFVQSSEIDPIGQHETN